jgi:hypothetical protein
MEGTLFSPRAQNKFKVVNDVTIACSIDKVWNEVSDLSKLTAILHPTAQLTLQGKELHEMSVAVTDGDNPKWTYKVFELNNDKKKLCFIIVGSNYQFSTYKCTLSITV